jgi:hypothetical protein
MIEILCLAAFAVFLSWSVYKIVCLVYWLIVLTVVSFNTWWYVGAITGLEPVSLNRSVDNHGQVVPQPTLDADGTGASRNSAVSLHLVCGRLRRRSRWVRSVEDGLHLPKGSLGMLVRGRWTPDLPSSDNSADLNLVLSHFEDGAKLLGGGVVPGENGVPVSYYHIELSDGSREVVFPELLSRLSAYALLRQRDAVLISALRMRALDWVKKKGLSQDLCFIVVTSAMRLALEVPVAENSLAVVLSDLGPESPRWWHRA